MPPRRYYPTKDRGGQLRLLLAVICRLHRRSATVADLAAETGAHIRTVWRVLAALRDGHMLESWREGRTTVHRLAPRWWQQHLPPG